MSHAKTCRQCGAEVALTRLPRAQGEDSGVRVEIEGMPAYLCARGHKRFLTPDFPLHLIEKLLNADGTFSAPHANKRGLIRKRYHCPGCGGDMPAESGRHASARHRIEFSDSATVDVALTLPLYRCARCEHDVLHPRQEVQRALMDAAASAFRSANVPPG
ncbi:MAG: hypothetical protein OEW21_17000 [Betaproteobacteria bacterium]|nr:hypothetical protein [Betaproteobacteria bacterium]